MQVTCPVAERPLVPGKQAQCPATACDVCLARPVHQSHPRPRQKRGIREDEQFQQKLRAKIKTRRGRARSGNGQR